MEERRGMGLLLFGLLLAQLVLLSSQAPARDREGSALEGAVLRLAAPVVRGVRGVHQLSRATGLLFADRRELRAENQRLQQELEVARREHIESQNAELELRLLRDALDVLPPDRPRVQIADVVWADHHSFRRSLIVRLQPADESPPKMGAPVMTHQGLVGRVVMVAAPYARVQLITDRVSSVGAMIERTRRQGVVRGDESGTLALDYLPLQSDVRAGDRLLTAGIDGVYPRGIPIGAVLEVTSGDDHFHRVRVAPAVDFGKLGKVYLLEPVGPPDNLLRGEDAGVP
jgi:rod shape-determining protein MreC